MTPSEAPATRTKLLWVSKCLLLSLAGMFVCGRISDLFDPLVWWALHASGATVETRPYFIADFYLPLAALYGFALGLVPLHRLQELSATSFGKVHFLAWVRPESDVRRPLLWAWVPVALVLAYRVVTYPGSENQSVLLSKPLGESRFEHFLAPFRFEFDTNSLVKAFDRFLLTGPTLFLLAYSSGVWLHSRLANSTAIHAGKQNATFE